MLVRVCSLVGRYFFYVFIVKSLKFINVKDTNICPC